MKKTIILSIFSLFSLMVFSQNTIKGIIKDFDSKETLPGVLIKLDTIRKIAKTDLDGKFFFENIPSGKYTLTYKYPLYDLKIDTINLSDQNIIIEVYIQKKVTKGKTIVIKSKSPKESTSTILVEQKNAAVVSDGISGEAIKKTPDRSTSDVLKRVSGASIQDNKFAIIRGLNDRYNAAYINGAPLPSSESDRKAFSFDIFPANMLDNLVIYKTATPELPGEFAGGIIQITTKSIADKNFQSISVNGGYNTITTGKDQVTYKGGKLDWLGVDDGTRAMPSNLPSTVNFPVNTQEQANLAKSFTNNWGTTIQKFSPNTSIQYSLGRTKEFKDSSKFGLVGALNYNRSNVYTTTIRRDYDNGTATTNSVLTTDFLDKNYSIQTMAGALLNLSYQFSERNKISLKNIYSVNTEDRVISRTGKFVLDETGVKSSALWFTSNQLFSTQLNGDHGFKTSKIKINWVGSYSNIYRNVPNMRRNIYTNNNDDTTYHAAISNNSTGASYGGSMFNSKNKEGIYSFKTDVLFPLIETETHFMSLKVGGFAQYRYRDFQARQFGLAKYNKGTSVYFNDSLLNLPENQIFSQNNMGEIKPGMGGFKVIEGTKPSDSYQANSTLTAGYLMFENKYKKSLRFIWGSRIENFKQSLISIKDTKDTLKLNHKAVLDFLPSANLIYSITDRQNLRLSYYQTVNRPEYRELAPFAFFDFSTLFVVSGNDSLQRAKIQNYDIRYEYYGKKSQMISATFFYKDFNNPIEQVTRADVGGEITYKNVTSAKNYGFEIETRVNFASILRKDSSEFLNKLSLFSNFSIIRSSIDLTKVVGAESRPLQGQSPYIFNAGISYNDNKKGWSATANLNKVGPRIFIVGNVNEPNIWENSRTFIDLQVTKSFMDQKLELKLNAQNILAQDQIFYQNNENKPTVTGNSIMNTLLYGDKNYNKNYDPKSDDLIWKTTFGRIFNFTVTYKF